MEDSAPKRRKTSPTNAVPIPGSAAGSTTPTRHGTQHGAGTLPSRTRRIAQRPSPRPLPPPPTETEEEDPFIDPFRGRVLHRSPPTGVLPTVPNVPVEELELPPTPTEKGISDPASVNTSPAGIHNTPSKRALRSKALAEKLKSSPLKQPPLRPSDLTKPPAKPPAKPPPTATSRPLLPTHYHTQTQTRENKVDDTINAIHEATENPTDRDQTPAPHPARQIKELGPYAEQKATRDSLLAEIAQLSGDIDFVARENERLQKPPPGGKTHRDLWPVKDKRNLLGLLRRHILPPTREPPPTKGADELLFAALNPISFLPFSKADQAMPAFFDASRPQPEASQEKDPPTSHYPIPLPAEEELPYLQAFAPLTFTSRVAILPREESDTAKPLLQRHTISVSSNPPGLFAARVQMTVNTKNLSVAELSVPQLDPSASRELRPFLDRLLYGRNNNNNNSALSRNVSVITWAMGEWVRLATRRARFWCVVERDLASREGIAKCVKQMRRGGKRGAADQDTDENEDDDEDEEAMDGPTKVGTEKSRVRRADLARYLGKSSFDLDLPSLGSAGDVPSIRIQWTIELDWTGEARSKMGLFVAAPARWHGRDKGRSLAGLPAMFDKLVGKKEDPMNALRTVVALLASDGSS